MNVNRRCPTRATVDRPLSTNSRAPVRWLRNALRLLVIPAGVLGSSNCGGEAEGSAPYRAIAMADRDGGASGVVWSTPRRLWAGGAARESGSSIAGIDWTPDGRKLVFMSGAPEGDTRALFEVFADGGDARLLAAVPDLADSEPRIHPDGRRIVYRAGQPRGEIWALDLPWPAAQALAREEEMIR